MNEEGKNKLVRLLEQIQLNNIEVIKCDMEADVYISKNYKNQMILTNDSDYLFHTNLQNIIKFIWYRGNVILKRFNRESNLKRLKINGVRLSGMWIVMSNDYDKNIPGKWWKTPIKIIKELLDKKKYKSVEKLVQAYCNDLDVSINTFIYFILLKKQKMKAILIILNWMN